MVVGIMQPYFMPYIGYFQLMNKVDKFLVFDNIEFTKKGWFHRNRMLVNGKDTYFSLQVKKDSDFLDINQRYLAGSFKDERLKTLRKIQGAYSKAPYFKEVFPVVESIFCFEEDNLFKFIYNSLQKLVSILGIDTELVITSTLDIDHSLKGQDKVIELCKAAGATEYINPPGGVNLYSAETFTENGLELSFIRTTDVEYPQFKAPFVPLLSIMDVMMFNTKDQIKGYLNNNFEIFKS